MLDSHPSVVCPSLMTPVSGRFPAPPTELLELSVLLESPPQLAALLSLYEEHISAEWYEPWDAYNWVAGTL